MFCNRHSNFARAVLVAVFLSVAATGCSGQGSSQPETPAVSRANTQDGALPISVTTSWLDALHRGQGEVVCGFSTDKMQQALVRLASDQEMVSKKPDCAKAAAALSKQASFPSTVASFEVESAFDTTTELTVVDDGDLRYAVSLTKSDEQWYIDTFDAGTEAGTEADAETGAGEGVESLSTEATPTPTP